MNANQQAPAEHNGYERQSTGPFSTKEHQSTYLSERGTKEHHQSTGPLSVTLRHTKKHYLCERGINEH